METKHNREVYVMVYNIIHRSIEQGSYWCLFCTFDLKNLSYVFIESWPYFWRFPLLNTHCCSKSHLFKSSWTQCHFSCENPPTQTQGKITVIFLNAQILLSSLFWKHFHPCHLEITFSLRPFHPKTSTAGPYFLP